MSYFGFIMNLVEAIEFGPSLAILHAFPTKWDTYMCHLYVPRGSPSSGHIFLCGSESVQPSYY